MKLLTMRLIRLWLAIPAMLIASVTFAATPPLEVVNLQLRWHHQFQFAGYYAAIEKGFYRDEGFDVRLHEGAPGRTPVGEVLAGRAQYAEGNSEILYARMQGKPLVALAAIFQHSASVLLAKKEAGISTPHDLIGKNIMLMDTTTDADFQAMLLHEGIKPGDVNIVPSSYDFEDLLSGKIDAFNSYLTNEPFMLQQRGIDYSIINPKDYGIDFYSDILFTTRQEVKSHPNRVAAMKRATLKGWHYAMAHPDEIIELLITKYQVKKSKAHLKYEADTMRELVLPDLIEIGHMNPYRWQRMAESFTKVGMAKNSFSLDDFIYDPSPKPIPAWVYTALIAGLLTLLILLAGILYFRQLNLRLKHSDKQLRISNLALSAEIKVREQAEQASKENEERLRLALIVSKFGWFELNPQTGMASVSPEYAEMLGFDPATFNSSLNDWQENLHPDDKDAALASLYECLMTGQPKSMEYRRRSATGDWLWVNVATQVITWDENHKPIRMIGTQTNISERKQLEDELKRQAHLDHLTGLNNRGRFMDQAEHELSRAIRYETQLSVLMMDIDHFKQINDTYGHKVGDNVLIKFAEICQQTLRDIDIIGRMGGEEFAILLPQTNEDKASEVAERLRINIENTKIELQTGGLPISVTVSIGIAMLTSQDNNIEALLSHADRALYDAKNSGRNKVCYAAHLIH